MIIIRLFNAKVLLHHSRAIDEIFNAKYDQNYTSDLSVKNRRATLERYLK